MSTFNLEAPACMTSFIFGGSPLWIMIYMMPSGKLSHNYGKSQFLMGKSTISMAIFNSYVILNYQMVNPIHIPLISL